MTTLTRPNAAYTARDWEARMPLDAPPVAKTLLARLKSGT